MKKSFVYNLKGRIEDGVRSMNNLLAQGFFLMNLNSEKN